MPHDEGGAVERDVDSAVLLLRVWREGPDPRDLRVRLTGSSPLFGPGRTTSAASSVDGVLAEVRAWLEAFLAGPAPGSGD